MSQLNGEEKICVLDTIASGKDEENEITNRITINCLIEELNDREKDIIKLRFFKNNTQAQVAEKLGISQVQISRIEKKLLLKMREKIVG